MAQVASRKISFGVNMATGREEPWNAFPEYEWDRRARCSLFTSTERIECAARSRMNKIGHAGFTMLELQEILGKSNEDGDLVLVNERTVKRAIDAAVERGSLAPGSSPLCLVVPSTTGQTTNRDSECAVHRIRRLR